MTEVVVEGAALAVPADEDLKNFANLSAEKQNEIKAQVEAMTSVTAEALIQNKGWDVLKQIYMDASRELLLTSGFVMPVRQQFDQILAKLSSPQDFKNHFELLQADLLAHHNNLKALWTQHQDKVGQPTNDDLPLVSQLAGLYSEAIMLYADNVTPRLNALIEIVRTEYAPSLALMIEETAHAAE